VGHLALVTLGVAAALILSVIRRGAPGVGAAFAVVVSLVLLSVTLAYIRPVLETLYGLAARAQLDLFYLRTVLKVIGVAYVVEFGAQIAADAQEGALAQNLQLMGKVLILAMAVPVVLSVVDIIIGLLG